MIGWLSHAPTLSKTQANIIWTSRAPLLRQYCLAGQGRAAVLSQPLCVAETPERFVPLAWVKANKNSSHAEPN